ncbi:hypothetical protein Mgra_00005307, partial [Meloidogyne graminicola]
KYKLNAKELNNKAIKNQTILSDSLKILNFLIITYSFPKNNLNKEENKEKNFNYYSTVGKVFLENEIEKLTLNYWGKSPNWIGLKNGEEKYYEELTGNKIKSSTELNIYFEFKLLKILLNLHYFLMI